MEHNQYLVFAIDMGKTEWMAAFPTRAEAVDYLNGLRPDGTTDNDGVAMNPKFAVNDCIEFAFIVESPHFVSFV